MTTNGDVLHELLTTDPLQPTTVTILMLPDWIATIPGRAAYDDAVKACLQREPKAASFFTEVPRPEIDADPGTHAAWLLAEFDPPVYSTDDETGERLLLDRRFVQQHGLLSNKPHKVYRMPDGMDLMDWMEQDNHEADLVWMDWDGNEYDLLADGSFVPKS